MALPTSSMLTRLRAGACDLPYGLIPDLGTDLPKVNPAGYRKARIQEGGRPLLEDVREAKIDTPYGSPSDSFFLATVAALTGAQPVGPDSVNILPTLTGTPSKPVRDNLILAPHKPANLAIRQGKWIYIGAQGGGAQPRHPLEIRLPVEIRARALSVAGAQAERDRVQGAERPGIDQPLQQWWHAHAVKSPCQAWPFGLSRLARSSGAGGER